MIRNPVAWLVAALFGQAAEAPEAAAPGARPADRAAEQAQRDRLREIAYARAADLRAQL